MKKFSQILILFSLPLMLLVACLNGAVGGPEKAAQTAFEQFAQQSGTPYQNITFETLSNDGTFATIRIEAQFRESVSSDWREMEAFVESRKVGNEWQASPFMSFSYTNAEQQRIQAEMEATRQQREAEALATEEYIRNRTARGWQSLRIIGIERTEWETHLATSPHTPYVDGVNAYVQVENTDSDTHEVVIEISVRLTTIENIGDVEFSEFKESIEDQYNTIIYGSELAAVEANSVTTIKVFADWWRGSWLNEAMGNPPPPPPGEVTARIVEVDEQTR